MSRLTKFPRMLGERLKCFSGPRGNKSSDSSKSRLQKWAFELSGYNKFGLYSDDLLDHTKPSVAKAITRLPGDVLDARNYRLIRAMQLDFLKIHLPREEWITFEEDRDYRYLCPYIAEIEAEMREIYEFGCANYRHEQ